MLDIQNEFGGSNPIGLDEYYAGGANVPAGTAGVPASGTISMDNLRGKSKAIPVSVSVSPNTVPEGSSFFVSVFDSGTVYPTIYWKLTDYTNLQDADFNTVSGSINYDYIEGTYPSFSFSVASDTVFEGTGTFKVTCYSNAARTTSVGSSGFLSVIDTYSTSMVAPTATTIYRYANLNTAYRASVVYMDTSGLVGSTVYYEVYAGTGTLTAADVDAPTSLTGTLTVPANGRVGITVRSTEWDGSNSITSDKSVYVRYRLTNSTGAILGTSSAITLKAMPGPSVSFSPTTIREGQATTISISMTNIPYDGAVSVFWRQSTSLGPASTADWLKTAGDQGTLTGELVLNAANVQVPIYAALDTLTESTEALYFFWCLNSPNGTGFWLHAVDIVSPAQITTASGSNTSVQITNISSYPASRTFTVSVLMDSSLNTANSLTVPAGQTSSNAINPFLYTATDGTTGTYNMQYQISNSSYETYNITRFPESFIFPVYGVEFFVSGTNTNGSTRTVTIRITSVPSLGYAREFTPQFRFKAAGGPTWGAWQAIPGNVVLTVPANATSSANANVYTSNAPQLLDLQLRVTRGGHENKYSPEYNGIWI